MDENQKNVTYDAFISYRHAELDSAMAAKLHKVLETYRIPRNLAKRIGKKSIARVFRDRDELLTSSSLSENINQALENSSYLIVICSPRTPESIWVRKEIETFISLHGHDHVLALLIEGEPADSFPPELLTLPDGTSIEPLAADIRAESKHSAFKLLKTEKLRLIAALAGCRFDDLRQRHRERTIKKVLSLSFALSAFFMVFTGVVLYQSEQVKLQKENAQRGQSLFLSFLSDSLLTDGDRITAILLALEALPENLESPERPYAEEAEYALCEALNVYKVSTGFQGEFSVKHKKNILYSSISPDGTMFLTVGADNLICVWDISNGSQLMRLTYDKKSLDDIAFFSPDNRMVVSNLDEGILKAWNIQTGEIEWSFEKEWESSYPISQISVTDDCSQVLYFYEDFADDKCLCLIDTLTGEVSISIPQDTGMQTISLSSHSRYGAVITDDNCLNVYDLSSQEIIFSEDINNPDTNKFGYKIIFSPEENRFLLEYITFGEESLDFYLRHYDMEDQTLLFDKFYSCSVIDPGISNLSYSSIENGYIIFSDGRDMVTLDDTGEEIFRITLASNIQGILAKDTIVFLSDSEGNCSTYSSITGQEYNTYAFHLEFGATMMHSRSGAIVASSTRNKKAYVIKLMELKNTTDLTEIPDDISKTIFSPSNQHIAILSFDGSVYEYNLETDAEPIQTSLIDILEIYYINEDNLLALDNENIYSYDLRQQRINGECSFSYLPSYSIDPNSTNLAYISDYNNVCIVNTLTMEESAYWEGDEYIKKLFYDESGNYLFLLTDVRVIALDPSTLKEIHTWETENINQISVALDGRICLAAEEILYLYDNSFTQITTIEPMLPVITVSFSPLNGDLIISMDKCFVVYDSSYQEKAYRDVEINIENFRYRNVPQQIFASDTFERNYLLDGESYKTLGRIQCILDIDADYSSFLMPNNSILVKNPIYSLDMLLEEAQKQLNGRILTPAEREEYFIEE